MNSKILSYLRELVSEELKSGKISAFIGYREVEDLSGKRRPYICRTPEDTEKLVYDSFCTQNLVRLLAGKTDYLKTLKIPKKKVGILVKGCDVKSLLADISENKIDRHDLWVIGVNCSGNIDISRIRQMFDIDVKKIVDDGKSLQLLLVNNDQMKLDREDYFYAKCLHCSNTKPSEFDILLPDDDPRKSADDLDFEWIEKYREKPFHLKQEFILGHLSRCTTCFACRDACPACHCNENCVMDRQKLPEPFLHKSHELRDILTYHFIHFYHLADRCTGCGECTRACPESIPLNVITDQLKLLQMESFGFVAGKSSKATAPLSLIKGEEVLEG